MTRRTDFDRIYEGTNAHHVPTLMRDLVRSYVPHASANTYLRARGDGWAVRPEGKPDHDEVRRDFEEVADKLREEYDAHFGPRIYFRGRGGTVRTIGNTVVLVVNWDTGRGAERFDESAEAAMEAAAKAYRRECGWDHTPELAGAWILCIVTTGGTGDDEEMFYDGNLVGFAILHDRDEDGRYESLAHMWTATAARRKGIAGRILAKARSRFPVTQVEGPVTESGAATLRAHWPEILRSG